MKLPKPLVIIFCSILVGIGIALCIVSAIFSIGAFLGVGLPICLWCVAILWFVIATVLRSKAKKNTPVLFAQNRALMETVARQTKEAIDHYLAAATNVKKTLLQSVIYSRPWILVCGNPGSGTSTLLANSGVEFPLSYPTSGSESDGAQVRWRFSNDAVYIDAPGHYIERGSDGWKALAAALQKYRPKRPVDGVALVVSAAEIIGSDDAALRTLARELRGKLDELISVWGFEFPVYLIINKADSIPGFVESFGADSRIASEVLGATFPFENKKLLPRVSFIEQFALLSASLGNVRLRRLMSENNANVKRSLCRFVIHFEGMQEKLATIVAELFKSSSFEGKPVFRGFYFTAVVARGQTEQVQNIVEAEDVLAIANHPLNPRKVTAPAPRSVDKTSRRFTSFFTRALFSTAMTRSGALVMSTANRQRANSLMQMAIAGAIGLVGLIFVTIFVLAEVRNARLLDIVKQDCSAALTENQGNLIGEYQSLSKLGNVFLRIGQTRSAGAQVMDFGLINTHDIVGKMSAIYFTKINRLIVTPAVKSFEYDIREKTAFAGELTGDQYDALYSSLKSYLSMSEAIGQNHKLIDTVQLREVLFAAVSQAVLTTLSTQRLPVAMETSLRTNIGLYLQYLKHGQFPQFAENQSLVAQARQRLARLPDASNLYKSVIARLAADGATITLDQLINRQGPGLLSSDRPISVLYTQEGYEKVVAPGIADACKNPYKIDWVLGTGVNKESFGNLDEESLRDGMTAAYFADYTDQWLQFIAAVRLEPFGDMPRAARMLQKLVADNSELALLLQGVSTYTQIKETGVLGNALAKAGQMKQFKSQAAMANKTAGSLSIDLGGNNPAQKVNGTFDALRGFASGNSLGGYEGYRDKVRTLAEKLDAVASQGSDAVPSVFNGSPTDPLMEGYTFTQNSLAGMPENLGAALQGPLGSAFSNTGNALSLVITKSINERWQREIVKPFSMKFGSRFPFNLRGEDAAFGDVMDFFRSSQGTFWGMYDRLLSGYLVKTESGWKGKELKTLSLSFSPECNASFSAAERIREIFFKTDGTPRALVLTIASSPSNKCLSQIVVNGQTVDLIPGGKPVQISWPVESATLGATLKVVVNSSYTHELSFGGQWGLMRLFAAGKVNVVNSSAMSVTWQINVQNMYMAYQKYTVQVAGADHPFAENPFVRFGCPVEIITDGD